MRGPQQPSSATHTNVYFFPQGKKGKEKKEEAWLIRRVSHWGCSSTPMGRTGTAPTRPKVQGVCLLNCHPPAAGAPRNATPSGGLAEHLRSGRLSSIPGPCRTPGRRGVPPTRQILLVWGGSAPPRSFRADQPGESGAPERSHCQLDTRAAGDPGSAHEAAEGHRPPQTSGPSQPLLRGQAHTPPQPGQGAAGSPSEWRGSWPRTALRADLSPPPARGEPPAGQSKLVP